jgi:hypothetical protein
MNLGDLWCLLPKLFPDNIVQILYGDTLVDFESFDEQEWLGVSEKAHFSDSFSKLNERFISGYFSLRVSRLKALSDNTSAVDFDSVLQHLTQHNIPKRNINGWLDFGSLSTFQKSKKHFLKTRHFNSLRFENSAVFKASEDAFKIWSEYQWLECFGEIRNNVRTPKLGTFELKRGLASYSMAYMPLSSLQEIFTRGYLKLQNEKLFLNSCFDALNKLSIVKPNHEKPETDDVKAGLFTNKLSSRRESILRASASVNKNFDLDNIINDIHDFWNKHDGFIVTPMHGDFCFSNLLWDSNGSEVVLIDPRGSFDSHHFSPFGYREYDELKLAHSFIAQYDEIMMGQEPNYNSTFIQNRTKLFFERSKLQKEELRYGLLSLFVSLLPLHTNSPIKITKFLKTIIWLNDNNF